MDARFKDGPTALVVLAEDEMGKVQGLWFEWTTFASVMEAKAEAIYNGCAIAKDKTYFKIIICGCCVRFLCLSMVRVSYCRGY